MRLKVEWLVSFPYPGRILKASTNKRKAQQIFLIFKVPSKAS